MKLRTHQERAIAGMRAAAETANRVLLVACTGFGKTVVIVHVVRGHLERVPAARALILVHRRELVQQTVAKLRSVGLPVAILQGDADGGDAGAPTMVASVQTLVARGERPPATLLFWDEAHHCPAATFQQVASAYPHALHLGATATPIRSDGAPLGDMFDALVPGAGVRELTAGGWLVPCDVLAAPGIVDDLWLDPVVAYEQYARGKSAIVFASGVEHARQVASGLTAAGYRAACIDGEMPGDERDDLLAKFAAGGLDVLTNVFCLTEGVDVPRAEACILARSCGHAGAFLQMVGRVLRPHPSKARALLLDLTGAVNQFGLPDEERAWSLSGAAVRRTERLPALSRCLECLAVFRPARVCPRCGAGHETVARIPRNLNRAEKLERLSGLSQEDRDERYMRSLRHVARMRVRVAAEHVERWAVRAFRSRFGRDPMLRRAG